MRCARRAGDSSIAPTVPEPPSPLPSTISSDALGGCPRTTCRAMERASDDQRRKRSRSHRRLPVRFPPLRTAGATRQDLHLPLYRMPQAIGLRVRPIGDRQELVLCPDAWHTQTLVPSHRQWPRLELLFLSHLWLARLAR